MILVTGAGGQVGSAVALELKRQGRAFFATGKSELDITNRFKVFELIKSIKPISVVHCAAYTAVDAAEDDKETCMKVNSEGTKNIAEACREVGAEMIYISTDYVFDGQSQIPYETHSLTNPISVYGQSKLDGEKAVIDALDKFYIVRTSWVFGEGGKNFVKTILRLAAEKSEINVVGDQIGSPTYAFDLAVLLCDMIESKKYGIYHATNEGFCSWADFAHEIVELSSFACKINAITSDEYPSKASRPKNSSISKSSLIEQGFCELANWQNALLRHLRASGVKKP